MSTMFPAFAAIKQITSEEVSLIEKTPTEREPKSLLPTSKTPVSPLFIYKDLDVLSPRNY